MFTKQVMYLIVNLVFPQLGFWSGNFFLIASFPDNYLLLPFNQLNQRTIGPENAHLKPDPGVLSHHEMTLTLNTHTPLLNS